MSDQLIIFDTTLRDGEQSPGASMTKDEKLRIARALERMKVDVIEAGFPASSNGDFEAVKAIADAIRDSTVCSLARANDRDIARAAEALKGAARSRIHTFIATSELHMEKKLRMTREQVLEQAIQAVRFARNLTDDIEFSPEDGYRSDPEFLARVVEAVIREGARTINIPDTVGYAIPELYGQFIKTLRERVPNSDQAIWSVHCHNDLGMAVANSLAGVKIGGARQVECTINGIGERAGNAALEEVVMALNVRNDVLPYATAVRTQELFSSSQLLTEITNVAVQPNKAIVGRNAFAHEAGIHQDGMLKNPLTYEIMSPQSVGVPANALVLGKHSGRHALGKRFEQLGFEFSRRDLDALYKRFVTLADRVKTIEDRHLMQIAGEEFPALVGRPVIQRPNEAAYGND
jgi:2-isopropylmalate synthase